MKKRKKDKHLLIHAIKRIELFFKNCLIKKYYYNCSFVSIGMYIITNVRSINLLSLYPSKLYKYLKKIV